ncbi:MAG: glycerate kinase [Elusimicrobiota bacterium]|jgi:glycerate kinase|nr:glycerate kinase [Elusimicrobiota bacterium]
MKILLMPNSLKGSMSAGEFCFLAQKHLKNFDISCLPVSDGGDGVLDVFKSASPAAKEYKITAVNAIGQKKSAPFLLLPGGVCVIETAKICGLGGLKKSQLNPLGATSYGIGQVVKAAIKKGAKTFYIGLGGVATNDGGAGMAQALGFKLKGKTGARVAFGAGQLINLASVSKKPAYLKNIKFIGLSDVKNPLLGKNGSACVYGPQKGATPGQVLQMERALTNYARVIKKDLGVNINKPRMGAAGAIAAGLSGFLGARLKDGSAFILGKTGARAAVKKCDMLITAEGKLDRQTFFGKAPSAVCALAKKYKKPVIFICGVSEVKDKALLKRYGITKVIEISRLAKNQQDSIKNAEKYLSKIFAAIK